MDAEFPNPPQFSVGQQLATLIATCEILPKAWEAICSISKYREDSYLLIKDGGVAYVAFPSFHEEDFFLVPDSKYGESNIQNVEIFSAALKGDDSKPALVHKGALNRFLYVLENSDFKAKVQGLKEQAIIFVGHSIGGAVAALATLWFLEKRLRNSNSFCITFGAPLFGNSTIQEAIGREDWLGRFCHVVCKYDIVPRMCLAPYESIVKPLDTIVPYWQSKMGIDSVDVSHFSISEAAMTLVNNVLKCTSDVRSPFAPIGTYMFCSTRGTACFEDSEAVLKLLHFSIHSQEGIPLDQIAGICISEHTGYGHTLEDIDKSLLNASQFANFVSNSSFEMGIALELEAIGVAEKDTHAFSALRKAGEEKNEQDTNIEKLNMELSKNQSYMAQLEWYKMRCKDGGPGYYDAFKQSVDKKDFYMNLARKRLEKFWDEIVEMEEKHVLPSDFRTRNKWINAGTAYRRLVEPLDIANHYCTEKENKSYLSDWVRPHRYIVLEKWMKEKEQTRTGRGKRGRTNFALLTQDSCFWARLEEACKTLPSSQGKQDMGASLQHNLEFENYVWNMIRDKSISIEVFLKKSSFMIWWQQYSQIQLQSRQWASSTPLFKFMANEFWKEIAFFGPIKSGKVENEKDMNIEKLHVELENSMSSYMAQFELYKTLCMEKNTSYYDAFKQHCEEKLNLARKELGKFWDGIVEMEEKHVLLSDFRTRNKWINAGTAYRSLVEPFDIAYHYGTERANKRYLSDGVRPHRYIVLGKWLEEGRGNIASLTQDSCFWARFEEARKALTSLQKNQDMRASMKECLEFEMYVASIIRVESISDGVFLEESSFMTWWRQYFRIQVQSYQWRSSSPMFNCMKNESWKKKV